MVVGGVYLAGSNVYRRRQGFGAVALTAAVLICVGSAYAWDEPGHSLVVDAALARLPQDTPAFVKSETARARLRFLASAPDRWRNLRLAPMAHINNPDHYFDLEWLPAYGLTPQTLPPYRYDFIAHIASHKATHPGQDYPYEPDRDPQHDKGWPGFGPYRICEMYVRLRSSWRTLNTYTKYSQLTVPGELEACRDDILAQMGVLSHYVADLAQPLHTTAHYDGWVGQNPEGYVTRRGYIHRLIDTTVIAEAGITAGSLPGDFPLPKIDRERLFQQMVAYTVESNQQVEKLYGLEKQGAFKHGTEHYADGCDFIEGRLTTAAAMLAALWESAYRDAGIDSYREGVFHRKSSAK